MKTEHILLLVEALERDRVLPCWRRVRQSLTGAERRLLASELWADRAGLVPLSRGGARERRGSSRTDTEGTCVLCTQEFRPFVKQKTKHPPKTQKNPKQPPLGKRYFPLCLVSVPIHLVQDGAAFSIGHKGLEMKRQTARVPPPASLEGGDGGSAGDMGASSRGQVPEAQGPSRRAPAGCSGSDSVHLLPCWPCATWVTWNPGHPGAQGRESHRKLSVAAGRSGVI